MAAENKEDFKITKEEVILLKEALEKEEFRKLLSEYVDEISDPENKRIFDEEIRKLEEERGYDAKLVRTEPGFVLKTTLLPSRTKAFINVGHNSRLDEATAKVKKLSNGKFGSQWTIPYSIGKLKEDREGGKKCFVVDVTFSTETFKNTEKDYKFTDLLISTALTAIERDLGLKIDRKHVRRMKFDYKGIPQPAIIRKKKEGVPTKDEKDCGAFKIPYPPVREETRKKPVKHQHKEKAKRKPKNEPKYSVVHKGEFDMQDHTHSPISTAVKRSTHLVVTIELPELDSSKTVELDVYEKQIILHNDSPSYHLELALPYPVNEDTCSAKFDKSLHNLVITLPVLPSTTPPPPHPHMTSTTPTLIEPINVVSENGNLADEPKESLLIEVTESKPTVRSDWLVNEEWKCPPFSYRQNEDCVSFVVHVPVVKETTVMSYFDEDLFHITFKGSEETKNTPNLKSYSFYVKFSRPNGCGQIIIKDKCKLDIGSDNMVIVVAKATTEELQKFRFGHSPTNLEERLFLTDANTSDVIQMSEGIDVWQQTNEAEAEPEKVVNVVEKDDQQCVIEVVRELENGISKEESNCTTTEEPKAPLEPNLEEDSKKTTTPGYCNGRTDLINGLKTNFIFNNELLFDLD